MAKVEYIIKPEHLGILGGLLPGEKSKMSPLNLSGEATNEEASETLREAGIINEYGELTEEASKTMGILAGTRAGAGFDFTGLPGPLEYMVYFCPAGEGAVSVTVTDRGLLINDPADPLPMVDYLKECMGVSNLYSSGFAAELADIQTLTLSALIDLRRKSILRALVEENPRAADYAPGFQDIMNGVNSDSRPNWQWFVANIRQMLPEPLNLTEEETRNALSELVAAGIISSSKGEDKTEEDNYLLSGEALALANRFQVIKGILKVSSCREDEGGKVHFSEFTCLQAGVFDIFYMEYAEGKFRINTLSPARIFELCYSVIRDTIEYARGGGAESGEAAAIIKAGPGNA